MHLVDGTLPVAQAAVYAVGAGITVAFGVRQYYKNSIKRIDYKIISGLFTAFVFMVTVIEIPLPFGSTEHPTGTPLMALFMGPLVTAFLSTVVLLLELLFREGGITTLGANVLSLGMAGGLAGWGVFKLLKKLPLGLFFPAFMAGLLGDLVVYLVTAIQLTLGNTSGKGFFYYFIAYLPGQLPLAIIEGLFTGLVLQFLYKRRPATLSRFGIL
jgi:cobalt/nickel transport system permease protein